MRVTMKMQISGTRNGADWPGIGESIDVPDGEALDLINAGIAEAAAKPAPESAAVEVKAETASAAKPAARKAVKE